MIGLAKVFAQAFDDEAKKRGFVVLDKNRMLGGTPIYKTEDWLITSQIKTMFPDTSVTITFTPQNPPVESSKQHLIRCEATWLQDEEKWILS